MPAASSAFVSSDAEPLLRQLRPSPHSPARAVVSAVAIAATILGVPLAWRVVVRRWAPVSTERPSYLPSVEAPRPRRPFRSLPIEELQDMRPGYVVIGDSMAGRVHPDRLGELTGESVAPIIQVSTGSGRWFLLFKNYVVASQVKPKYTFVYFRDTNLTDVTWRLLGDQQAGTDEAAMDYEPELDDAVAARTAGGWFRVHRATDDVYQASRARSWLQPALTFWPARVIAGTRRGHDLERELNQMFALDRLRPIPEADMAAALDRDADFHANINRSILPAWLALARQHGLRLCFVRVQRRTLDGQPRPQSPALVRYVAHLREYVTRGGAAFVDERDYPAISVLPYHDGDHLHPSARVRYTEALFEILKALPQ